MIRGKYHATRFGRRRGTVAVMTALMLPALLGAAALAIDLGVWYRAAARLQLAADAGAVGAARLLAADTAGTSAYQAAALIEVNGVTTGAAIGTLQTPVTVNVASDWSQVTVTLASTPASYFARAVGYTPPAITATATAGLVVTPTPACVLALASSAADAIQIDNQGSIVATGCPIFANSTSATAIYLNSGTLSGSSVGAAGGVVKSNSGSNNLSPATPTSYATAQTNPYASLATPSYGATNNFTNNYTSYGQYSFTQAANVFAGNVTIGGNGSTDSFAPGTYYIVNGNLTFTNANITSASGVTFVLTGSSPGAFSWSNNSNGTMTAPTTGALAGILVYQTCASSGSDSANSFSGGSTLQASGAIYTPCGALDLNNNAQLKTVSGSSLSVVANTIYATGSGSSLSTNTASGGSSSSTTQIVLLQ